MAGSESVVGRTGVAVVQAMIRVGRGGVPLG
jgi:hypothetical protein